MPTTTLLLSVLALASPQEPTPAPPTATVDVSPAVRATNELGIALYRALDKEQPGKNLLFSPLSISVAMAMLAEGARDETAAELRGALHLDPKTPLADVHADFHALLARFREGGGNGDPELRERVRKLREQLDAANKEAIEARGEGKFDVAKFDEAKFDAANARGEDLVAELTPLLSQVDRYELRIANGLWIERAFPIAPAFVATLDRHYGVGNVDRLDFAHSPEAARERINDWVEQRTERHIQDVIPSGRLTKETALVIGNAVFFRGEWTDPFSEDNTRDDNFQLADGQRTKARLMHDAARKGAGYAAFTGDGAYFSTPELVSTDEAKRAPTYPGDDGFAMIELPYKGGELAMVVIAPRSPTGLGRLEAKLDATSLASWLTHLDHRKVDTAMLRFEQGNPFPLARALQSLGVRRAFTINAQLEGICDSQPASNRLWVSGVDHAARVQVTERGTIAAATTMKWSTRFGYANMVPFMPVFRADRPFLFLIRDVKSGAILFLGRVVDPRT